LAPINHGLSIGGEIAPNHPNHPNPRQSEHRKALKSPTKCQWIGLRGNLQETIDFPMMIMGFSGFNFPLNQSIENVHVSHF
jgi:hypothetical protein